MDVAYWVSDITGEPKRNVELATGSYIERHTQAQNRRLWHTHASLTTQHFQHRRADYIQDRPIAALDAPHWREEGGTV